MSVNKGVKPIGFLMRNPNFGTLLVVNLVSSLVGSGVGIALSVHLYQLTLSPLWTAVLAAVPTVAGVAFGHLAGTVTDRWSAPLRIIRIALFLRVLVLVALFALADSPLGLVCAVFAQAVLQQLYNPAEQVLIADYVTVEDLAQANGLNSFASNATRLVGPALGGFIMGWAGFRWTAIAVTALMLLATLLSLLLRGSRRKTPTAGGTAEEGEEGGGDGYLAMLRRSRRVRGLVLLQLLDAIKEGPLSSLFPVLMLGVIGATSAQMGLVNSAFAVSAVIAGPVIGTVVRRLGYRLPVLLGAAISNGAIVVLAIWPSLPLALIAFVVSGLPFTISWVGGQTWLLLSTPRSLRGRIVGTTGALYAGVSLVAMLASGVLAEWFGPRWVIGLGSFIAVAGLIGIAALLNERQQPTSTSQTAQTTPAK
ncbi:MFS transporter [Sphaerisporangium aureirubrum]|uniref:MFS transporter n=1 Tax=Sphaerisporangium aureirubrum TaxID=1544736 RepID=A0ABW1NHQ6_9ACTN